MTFEPETLESRSKAQKTWTQPSFQWKLQRNTLA